MGIAVSACPHPDSGGREKINERLTLVAFHRCRCYTWIECMKRCHNVVALALTRRLYNLKKMGKARVRIIALSLNDDSPSSDCCINPQGKKNYRAMSAGSIVAERRFTLLTAIRLLKRWWHMKAGHTACT